jgi:hypothetical protein
MSARPVHDPRFDPQALLQALPKRWRPVFLAQYREAAREPGECHRLPELAATARYPAVVLGRYAADRFGIDRPGRQIIVAGRWMTVIGILHPLPLAPDLDAAALVG